jgi:hypothetical protein
MDFKIALQRIVVHILIAAALIGCTSVPTENASIATPISATSSPILNTAIPQPTNTPEPKRYKFPDSIDPAKRYLIYLHGKIIEDQGIPAISPDYGEYEYTAILETLSEHDFIVISDQRPKNADAGEYARKVREQVTALLKAGVPAYNITVVGASKGAAITVLVSHTLKNEEVNFVIMGICHPDYLEGILPAGVNLYGNVLSIYDSSDDFAGSCQALFSFSEGKGISRYDEVVLEIGTGHGILYQPLDAWVNPAVQWAKNNTP